MDFFFKFFAYEKLKKTTKKSCSESAQTPFFPQSSPGNSPQPKIVFHVMKFRDQTSVLLSVQLTYLSQNYTFNSKWHIYPKMKHLSQNGIFIPKWQIYPIYKGPSINYVILKLVIFDLSPSLSSLDMK